MQLFTTPRLRVRRLRADDTDGMLAIYGDTLAMRWVGDGVPLTRAQCAEWMVVTEANYARRGYGMFGITPHESDVLIGCCGLVHPGGQDEAEIKYALRRDHWGRGIASEVVPALLAYAFDVLKLPSVIATASPENLASTRILVKAGMQPQPPRHDDGAQTALFRLRRADRV